MRVVYFDIEANGFLDDVTKLWTASVSDGVSKASTVDIPTLLQTLTAADTIVGHNVIGYDLPVLSKLYPEFRVDHGKVVDTLVLSRLLCPDLSNTDREPGATATPTKVGSHSLEAWGQRLGFEKMEWKHGFDKFHPDMPVYCQRDVDVTVRLHEYLLAEANDQPRAVELEHKVAWICAKQEQRGFPFDTQAANALVAQIHKEQLALELRLQDTFAPFFKRVPGEPFIPKRTTKGNADTTQPPGTWEGAPYSKVQRTIFNPNSRQHIADRLHAIYGWKPKEFTPSGQAKIDETVLKNLPYPEAKLLARYLLLQKRYGYLVNEDNERGLLNHVNNGRIHGRVITNGAVTGRATHKVIANLPRVKTEYGPELRALFIPSADKVMVGVDMSGIELRLLAHFMSFYDAGEYGKHVCNEDIHVYHQNLIGLPTRDNAKTFIYALIYGAGDNKLGSITRPDAGSNEQRSAGRELRERMMKGLPAFAALKEAVGEAVNNQGYLRGLDNRKLHIRSEHAALNTLLQSAGAVLSKQWMVEVDNLNYPTANQLIWYHDELQFEVSPEKADDFGKLVVECIQKAGDLFKIRVPLAGEYKIGNSWKECH